MSAGIVLTLLLAAIVALALVAKKLRVPYPIVFVIGGAAIALVPGVPAVALEPDLVFLLFLPPLIFGDGWTTDVRAFSRFRRPILILAIGLVVFTSICVAYVAHWMLGFPLALGFVLGAILSPTDAVATDAIAEEVRLPRQLAAIVGGESLVNDASSLVIYAFAVTAVTTGSFSLGGALLQFVYVVVVGLGIGIGGGWLLAKAIHWVRESGLSDELIVVSISLLAPFALYVPADALHASGVLAAMSGGMMISRRSSEILDAPSRIAAGAVWNLLFFTFNGAAFVLVGLQLRSILGSLGAYAPLTLAAWSLAVAAVVIVARFVWIFALPPLRKRISPKTVAAEGPEQPWTVRFVAATAGMRGVVSLAAALALPATFPHRELILFVVFVVIVVTLVGEGLAMPMLIERWHVAEPNELTERALADATVRLARAARRRLRELAPTLSSQAEWEIARRLASEYDHRIAHFTARTQSDDPDARENTHHAIYVRLRREVNAVERLTLREIRAAGTIPDDAFRRIETQLDHAESRT